jgi:ribosomal protein S6
MCLLDNREVRKGWPPLKDAVTGFFTKHGAEVLSSRRWDERRLGYLIKGQPRGTFLLVYFKSDTQVLGAIRRDLQFAEPVLRYLTLQCDEVPATAYEPEAAFDVNAIPEGNALEPAVPAAVAAEPVVEESPEEGPVAPDDVAAIVKEDGR